MNAPRDWTLLCLSCGAVVALSRLFSLYTVYRVPGYLGTWVPGYLGTWVPGYLGTWVPGYLGTWVPGYLGTWVPGYLVRSLTSAPCAQVKSYLCTSKKLLVHK